MFIVDLVFYSWGEPMLVLLMIVSVLINYIAGVLLGAKRQSKKTAKLIFVIAIILNLGLLGFFKYAGFIGETLNFVLPFLNIPVLQVSLPIGISFYTFQTMSYTIDVYRNTVKVQKNIITFGTYVSLFPQLIAGPIVRYEDVAEQLMHRKESLQQFTEGVKLFLIGLSKKVLLANEMGSLWDAVREAGADSGALGAWVGIIAYTLQIYFDFSGYSDMAIGLGRMFGFEFMKNFDYPYISKSITEFWRRWHISLGTWFKNYIFYPVSTSSLMKKWNKYGRKHCGKYLTNVVISAIALFPVWMLNGLWHGPQTTYIMYGVYYFVILLLEVAIEPVGTMFWNRIGFDENGKLVSGFKMVRTWMIILIGEMLFRANSLKAFGIMMKNMFTAPYDGDFFSGKIFEIGLDAADYIVAIIGIIIVFAVELKMEKNPEYLENIPKLSTPKRWAIYYALILAIVIFGAYGAGYQPADLIYAGF